MLPCSTSWIADILFSLLCFNHSDGKQKTVMIPTSVFPEIDGCLQGQSQGEGGGGFLEGCKLQIWFHSI